MVIFIIGAVILYMLWAILGGYYFVHRMGSPIPIRWYEYFIMGAFLLWIWFIGAIAAMLTPGGFGD